MNDIIFAGKHVLIPNVGRHMHQSWELIYCTGEGGRLVFDGLELPYAAGDVAIIPPEMSYANISSAGFSNIYLNLDNATLSFRQPAIVHDDANQSIRHLFDDAYYIFCSDPERRAALLSSYGNLLVRHMLVNRTSHPKNRVVEEIEQSIMQNYASPSYELDVVLQSMPYCHDYLSRLFRQEVNATPHQYLTNLRLQVAAETLASGLSNGNITEIARMCGFRDPLYFSRLFKKKYEISPSEYFRQKQQEQSTADAPLTPAD